MRVVSPGMLTTVQDGGRIGHAASGIGAAGAMDGIALRLANILVHNAQNAAALEITLRGPRLRFAADVLIAIAGADIDARCDEQVVAGWRPVLLRAGSELAFGGMRHGVRAYLAVAGGFDLPLVLGSRSTDINAGLGPIPRALKSGDVLPCAAAPRSLCADLWRELDRGRACAVPGWALDATPWFDRTGTQPLRAIAGTHFDRLDAQSQQTLFAAEFRIGVDSNRVGCRFEGANLALDAPLELISEGVAPGTMQLPPDGTPIVLTAEAPPTGGYPRIAHVIAVDQPHLAQRRAGDGVRFAQTDLADAQMRYLERERAVARLRQNVTERLHRPC